MRMLRYLLAMAMVAALSGVARADGFDFQTVVIDPIPSPSEITPITNPTFPVTLSPCQADQLDGLSPTQFIGCFTGLNVTGVALTSLQMEFPAIFLNGLLDQPDCPVETQNVFTTISCGFTDSTDTEYFLDFSGGIVPPYPTGGDCGAVGDPQDCEADSIFTIAIGFNGSSSGGFDDLPQNFLVVGNATAEPTSFWLMLTGVLSAGLLGVYKRRELLLPTRG
jgi:hypothetical protein